MTNAAQLQKLIVVEDDPGHPDYHRNGFGRDWRVRSADLW